MRQSYNFSYPAFSDAIGAGCATCEHEFKDQKMPPKKKVPAAASAQEEDVSMADASPAPAGSPELDYDIEIDEQRIRIVSPTTCQYYGISADHYTSASRSLRYCRFIRIQEGGSHIGKCFAVYHHEEVSLPCSQYVSTGVFRPRGFFWSILLT